MYKHLLTIEPSTSLRDELGELRTTISLVCDPRLDVSLTLSGTSVIACNQSKSDICAKN